MLSGRAPRSRRFAKAACTAMGFVLAAFACLGFVHLAHAQAVTTNELLPDQLGAEIGTGTTDIRITVARIVRIAFGLLGTIALLLVLYAGFLWMTAAGDEEKVRRAKSTLASAIIGLVIILAAFGITSFIISRLLGASEGGGPGTGGGSAGDDQACIGLSATCPAGALGNGIVESHYPARNATGVPRNTRIAVTFKEKIDPASLAVGPDGSVAILKSSQIAGNSNQFPQKFAQSLTSAAIDIAPAGDGKTFVFLQKNCPTDCFGSPSENVFYTVVLRGGSGGVKKEGGAAAFSGTFSSGYLWEFQVSTQLDVTPPTVESVQPPDGANGVARNSLIQATFSEPVDPVSLNAGLSVTRTGGNVVQGTQTIGNAYRTVEFRTSQVCGTNSCGEQVYCLPANQDISVKIRADALTTAPPAGVFPANGVTDMAGNSLDGNGNGTAQGGPADDYGFAFSTGNQIDLTPPKVVSQDPAILQGDIPRDARMSVTFSKLMSATSITTDAMRLLPGPQGAPTNYAVSSQEVSSTSGGTPDQTQAFFNHDLFSVNQGYAADLTPALRDLHQNCFAPANGQAVCTGSEPFCCNGLPSQTACGFLQP